MSAARAKPTGAGTLSDDGSFAESRYHRRVRIALVIVAMLAVDAAAAPPSIRFTKGPDGKYRCTRYAPGITKSDPLRVLAPAGKSMIFSYAAVASDRSKVSYRADGLPPGAIVDAKGLFTWKIPADAKGTWTITLVAESPTAKATQTFTLAIAEPDLVAAWRAGMGNYEPDCSNRLSGYDFLDVNADGKTDLVFTIGDESDDSANQGSYRSFIRLRTATGGFDTVERIVTSGSMDPVTLPDGKPALVIKESCCCIANLWVVRITATGADELASVAGTDCLDFTPIETETNAKHQLHRIITRFSSGDAKTETVHVWRNGRFERK